MKIVVFISGRGSNLKALLDLLADEAHQVVVVSDKDSPGLSWAKKRGVPTQVIDFSQKETWQDLAKSFNTWSCTHIFLLGFMKIVPDSFLGLYEGEIYNIHPSFLPSFPGLGSLKKTYHTKKAGGCTLHRVSSDLDQGEIILQKKIEAKEAWALDEFSERVHHFEQRLVAQHLRRIS